MTDWEFLIQREGDRGWRTIKTGKLQLTEGKYRIVANGNIFNTQIQTRITHQTLGVTPPQRQSRSGDRTSNSRGLVVIIPFTHLQAGIWQFVCSGIAATQTPWHQILKLRVLPRTPVGSGLDTDSPVNLQPQIQPSIVSSSQFAKIETVIDEIPHPTEPIVPISMLAESPENWADGLDRLLAQLERDSLQAQSRQSVPRESIAGGIQLSTIFEPPSQLISLNRSTFSGLIPGNRLTIGGLCNLQLVNARLLQTVKIEKLSICLRHPQTSETIVAIEQALPPHLDTFAFRGQIELPLEPKTTLLLGEVNLYDKHHIQLGSSGFTVTINLNPLYESELSLLQLFEGDRDNPEATLAQITEALKIEAATIGLDRATAHVNRFPTPSTIQPPAEPQYPTVPLAYRRDSRLARHPDIVPVKPHTTNQMPSHSAKTETHLYPQTDGTEITADLDLDFADLRSDRATDARHYPNLEVVIDD